MNKDEAKILAIVGLGLGSLVSGLLPVFLNRRSLNGSPLLMTILLCFGAGVLLCTSLVHILPEVREDLTTPGYSEIVFCLGFILVYLSDELIHLFFGEAIQHSHAGSDALLNHGHSHSHSHSDNSRYTDEQENLIQQSTSSYNSYGSTNPADTIKSPVKSLHDESDLSALEEHLHKHEEEDEAANARICHVNHVEPCRQSFAGHIGLLTALCVHSMMEGLAIGVQDSTSKVVVLVTAVASHKLVVGFCLGVELSTDGRLRNTVIAIIVFAMGSVLGIFIGMGLVDMDSIAGGSLLPILQGVAGGTLLYVTVCEVLPREKSRWHQNRSNKFAGMIQLLAFAIGFGVMVVLSVYIKEE